MYEIIAYLDTKNYNYKVIRDRRNNVFFLCRCSLKILKQ